MRFGSQDENNKTTTTTLTNTSLTSVRTSVSHTTTLNNSTATSSAMTKGTMNKKAGKRPGRKPAKIDERAKLERSRQSAKECRARKKLRYQYLEELVTNREKTVLALKDELELVSKPNRQIMIKANLYMCTLIRTETKAVLYTCTLDIRHG